MPVQQLHQHTYSAGVKVCKNFLKKTECDIKGSVKCYEEMYYICWGSSHLRSSGRLKVSVTF